ncbi:ankyrin [Hyaloscypha hepaticicola]|uniref:Ankyrin n=1 Tax=Hyaloscypha hepaticicola TaxID=2082293 RepID=A0A2J6Q5J7_9HELO|nr:ankyrin [Hyaloscypha hepaticicola]
MLHLHGIGTKQCLQTALKWLELSALAGSLKAKLVLLQVLSAVEVPLNDDLSSILDDVVEAYPPANQRKIAEAISVLKPEAFEVAVERARWSHLDLLTRTTRNELVSIMIEGRRIIALNIKSGETVLPLQDWLAPLQREVLFGEVQEVRRLVREACNIDETRIANHSALWLACNCGFTDMAMALLEAGASPNIADSLEGYSALHFLARFPQNEIPEIARTLVARGADLEARTSHGETPLLTVLDDEKNFMPFACSPAVDVLLSLGASPYGNLKESHVLGDHRVPWPDCPLSRACTINADAVIILLERIKILRSVDQADDGSPPSQSSETTMEPEPSQTSQREYMTALMARCFRLAVSKPMIYRLSRGRGYKGSLSRLVKYLLVEDVRSQFSKLSGMPALLYCCKCLAYDFCEEILEQKLYSTAELADTRLILLAFTTRNPNLVRQLITAGASLSLVNDDGLTFLHHAVKHRWCVADLSEICDLVSDAIDLHDLAKRRDSGGATPFDYAVQQGSLQLADFLARFGVEVNVCAFRLSHSTSAPFGWPLCTLLGYCLATTEDDILKLQQVRYLLKYSPKFRVSPSHGCTALTLCWTPWKQQRKRCKVPQALV